MKRRWGRCFAHPPHPASTAITTVQVAAPSSSPAHWRPWHTPGTVPHQERPPLIYLVRSTINFASPAAASIENRSLALAQVVGVMSVPAFTEFLV
jgi:hypothetical protein